MSVYRSSSRPPRFEAEEACAVCGMPKPPIPPEIASWSDVFAFIMRRQARLRGRAPPTLSADILEPLPAAFVAMLMLV